MAFSSGTATDAVDFLDKMNTFIVANGWTLLDGTPATDPAETWFAWSGVGFDVIRKPYIYARAWTLSGTLTDHVEINMSSEFNALIPTNENVNFSPNSVYLPVNSTGFDYWIFENDLRLVIIIKNDANDYTSAYLGFFQPFALPAEYPFPMCIISNHAAFRSLSNTPGNARSIVDPGATAIASSSGTFATSSGKFFKYNEGWKGIANLEPDAQPMVYPGGFIYPNHVGSAPSSTSSFPNTFMRNSSEDFGFEFFRDTVQGFFPMFPSMIGDFEFGLMGSLSGVFTVVSESVIPEQLVTISTTDYRIFPARTFRSVADFFAVLEE